ncbi:unnamed protein product, partial [Cyprideis torosa]
VELPFKYTSILRELWENGELQPQWNSQVEEVRVIKMLNKNTMINYQISAPAAGGLVTQRDFVAVIRIEKEGEDTYWFSFCSIDYSGMQKHSDYVRGIHMPGSGFKLQMAPDDPNKTIFTWIMFADMKFGFIPKSIINKLLPSQIKLYYENLNLRMASL